MLQKKHDFESILEAKMKLFPITRRTPKYGFRLGGVHIFEIFRSRSWSVKKEALESWESLPFETMSRGQWKRPTCASALLPVIRSRDMREFLKHGTPYTVRPCINLRSSGVNDMFLPWPFRMAGPDSVARLLGRLLRRPQADLLCLALALPSSPPAGSWTLSIPASSGYSFQCKNWWG